MDPSCVCHNFASVHCCLVVNCWERVTSCLSFVMVNCVLVIFPFGILGQVWYLIVSIPDFCHISYFVKNKAKVHFVTSIYINLTLFQLIDKNKQKACSPHTA